jgi:hypothetical protein
MYLHLLTLLPFWNYLGGGIGGGGGGGEKITTDENILYFKTQFAYRLIANQQYE